LPLFPLRWALSSSLLLLR